MISGDECEVDVMENVKEEAMEEAIDIESVEESGNLAEVVEEEDSGEWSFETDYVALKNNQDYLELLKTVVTLQVQRVQMVKDMETVLGIKEEALKDPLSFVKKIERKESLGIPPRLTIAKIPEINWGQYNFGMQNIDGPATRGIVQKAIPAGNDMEEENLPVRVRGRAFNESKPETFNQLWTAEEQQRLEELLVEFPPEEKESRRWGKIAAALGNRTKNQVTSRVQKYFIKLHKAGLPVPGRIPRAVTGFTHRHAHQRYNHHLFRPTTFFPAHPYMGNTPLDQDDTTTDSNQDGKAEEWGEGGTESDSDSDDATMQISEKVAEANASRTIRLLERVAEDKEKDWPDQPPAKHSNFKCDLCQEEPLLGTRWHCTQCAVDYCGECVVTQLDSADPHPSSHHLEPIRSSKERSKDRH